MCIIYITVNSGQTTYFDAFVSYCHDDFPFVQEMIRMLETVHGLKLCVNARDLLAGASTYFVTARLIADRLVEHFENLYKLLIIIFCFILIIMAF